MGQMGAEWGMVFTRFENIKQHIVSIFKIFDCFKGKGEKTMPHLAPALPQI
jgi:hypothetical protein